MFPHSLERTFLGENFVGLAKVSDGFREVMQENPEFPGDKKRMQKSLPLLVTVNIKQTL